MMVHYALVNKILVDCGIAVINLDHDEGKEESPKIRFILNQVYRIISMDETSIEAYQSKDIDRSKGVCTKGGGWLSTNKDKKGTKGGVLSTAVGLNWGGGNLVPPMFVFAWGIPPPLSRMMLGLNDIAFSPGSVDPYQAR